MRVRPFWFPGMTITRDSEEGLGPLHGLRTALVAAQGDPLIVVAWDMPFVTTALLRHLRALGETGVSAVIPTPGRTVHARSRCARTTRPRHSPSASDCSPRVSGAPARCTTRSPRCAGLARRSSRALGDPTRLLLSVDTLSDLAAIGGRLPDGEDTARR